MRYLGGKTRLAKKIAAVIEQHRQPGQRFYEPFCGGLSVTAEVTGERYASDVFEPLIVLYQAVQGGWLPPDELSEAEYKELRQRSRAGEISPLITWAGFCCSFGGKWFNGYAREGTRDPTRNLCGESKRLLIKRFATLGDVDFSCRDYRSINPTNAIIYCDAPYNGTTGYKGTPKFDHYAFWDQCRQWKADGNTVIISEYSAPTDFELIAEYPHFLSVKGGQTDLARIERVFKA